MAKKKSAFIKMPSPEVLAQFPTSIPPLLKKGRHQGFITKQELIKSFPNCEEDIDSFSELLDIFENLGVKIIDSKEEMMRQEKKTTKKVKKTVSTKDKDDEDSDDEDGDDEDEKEEEENPSDEELLLLEKEIQEKDETIDPEKKKKQIDLSEISNDSVRMYLAEIGKVPLLSPEDEIKIARKIRKGSLAAKKHMAEANL